VVGLPVRVQTAGMTGGVDLGPVQLCLFDVDGVLRTWRMAVLARFELDAGVPAGTLARVAHCLPEYERGVRGEVSFDGWCTATREAIAEQYGKAAADALVAGWRSYRGDVCPDVVEVVREVRPGCPVAVLSNAHDSLAGDLVRLGLGDDFDLVFCSATLGLAKPDPAIFRRAAALAGVPVADCLFVDDLADNVQAARGVGMRSVHFTDVAALRDALAAEGLLRGPVASRV